MNNKRRIKIFVDAIYGNENKFFYYEITYEKKCIYAEGLYLKNIPIFSTKLTLFLSLIFNLIRTDKKGIYGIEHYYLDTLEYDYIINKL